jgi:hypothetical protein
VTSCEACQLPTVFVIAILVETCNIIAVAVILSLHTKGHRHVARRQLCWQCVQLLYTYVHGLQLGAAVCSVTPQAGLMSRVSGLSTENKTPAQSRACAVQGTQHKYLCRC